MQQLEGRDLNDLEAAELQPIQLGMQVMKDVGAKWLVELADNISNNPQFLVNGFIHSGITGAIDGTESDTDKTITMILMMGVTTSAAMNLMMTTTDIQA